MTDAVHGLRRAIFGTQLRRTVALVLANAILFGLGPFIHTYIDESCGAPGLSFALVLFWAGIAVTSGFITTLSLSPYILGRAFMDRFLTDPMAELDARLDPDYVADDLDDMELVVDRGDARFGLFILIFTAGSLLASNALSDGFLQRYSYPGVAIVHMRSDVPADRRAGMDMLLAELGRGNYKLSVTPAVEAVVLDALNDPDEGVIARAAFVSGTLDIEGAVDTMATIAETREALTFTTLISLGQIDSEKARAAARRLVQTSAAQREPHAMVLMLGLLKVGEADFLRTVYEAHPDDEDIKFAVIWALGELRDARLLEFVASALKDPSVAVQCAAVGGLEKMVVTATSPYVRAAFEALDDKSTVCPEKNVPVQEGGSIITMLKERLLALSMIRALATTDDPTLIHWLVAHQTDVSDYRTGLLMGKLWKKLKAKDARGELNAIRRRLKARKVQEAQAQPDSPEAGDDGSE